MKSTKRILALLLALTMLVSMAACGTQQPSEQPEDSAQTPVADPNELSREDQELIADLIGGEQNADELSDEALDELIDQLLNDAAEEEASEIVNLGGTGAEDLPTVDTSANGDAYDENGAMTKPFDQVYPELIEKEQVAFSDESLLIKLESDTLTDGLKAAGIGALEAIVPMEGAAWYEAKLLEGTDAQAALTAVRGLEEVLLAEYNYEIQTAGLDDYKHFDKDKEEEFKKNGHNKDQWHFHYVGIPDGYEEMDTEGGLPSVVVAVIDSGVDYDHEDLADNMWVNAGETPDNGIDDDGNGYIDDYYGIDLIAGRGSADDDNGHGTHVAGIIAAKNNNTGVVGIAYNVKIMPIKAAMHNGTLNQADIARAVLYAYEMGAEVINMSFGGVACSIAVQDALATAYTRSVLVASAGNSGYPNQPSDYMAPLPNYPAALTYVLGVMSVDEQGVESSFTNWDTTAFNGVEYELYAPGENIMSTLPGDRYGFLSGTSMAAPMVAAMAAILRSEFSDRDLYPTKFIYGQLASTSDYYAECIDPKGHEVNGQPHNLPQIVNLNAALTKLPKPEVGMQDYAIFDSVELSDKNNGDGVIDAGETIALGLTLVNRWGMSENTLVTVDTLTNAGISDPYVEIVNPTVDYGSVGTYSTQDCGKIMTDGLHTGWEDPFIIKIADDIPNDYRMTFNVTVKCENALDEADTATYTSEATIDMEARNGVVLPSIIEEDMVLTKENLYIIPNSTVIAEGVTVRVEPGTHIQFWGDDASDPYADSYIAYLLVNGNFLVEGTKEEPVYIYPSQLMDHYGVEIGASDTGYVSLKYADITNFFYNENHTGTGNKIDLAERCTFRNNYVSRYYSRYLSGGVVYSHYSDRIYIGTMNAKDCVFYKIHADTDGTAIAPINGTLDRCIFVQCAISHNNNNADSFKGAAMTDCVFLGNSLVDQTDPSKVYNSSLEMYTLKLPEESRLWVYYREETGTTYVKLDLLSDVTKAKRLAQYLQAAFGGDWLKIETAEEQAWFRTLDQSGWANVTWDALQECYAWSDGTPLDLNLFPNAGTRSELDWTYVYKGELLFSNGISYAFYEIPGQILPEEITFDTYKVAIDLESAYQVSPKNTPVQLPLNGFLYESSDEAVVTVSDTGLVTPVGLGTADVYVYSLDKAVSNYVTVEVKDYVALESLAFPVEAAEVAAGETLKAACLLTPADTTRRNVVYTSSDEAVATVDEGGIITGIGSGTATITATCEGITATMEVTVCVKATSLTFDNLAVSAALTDGTAELPGIVTNEGAETILSWRSTDEAVAAIEDGKLVLKALGTTSVIVTDHRSGLSAACLVIVSEDNISPVKDISFWSSGIEACYLVLLEDGSLYAWDTWGFRPVPTCILTGAAHASIEQGNAFVALEDGTLQRWQLRYTTPILEGSWDAFVGRQILDMANYLSQNFYVITAEGYAYAWGSQNSQGQLGIGSIETADAPVLLNLENVVQVMTGDSAAWFLTGDGKLYCTGSEYNYWTPTLLREGIAQIHSVRGADAFVRTQEGRMLQVTPSGGAITHSSVSGYEKVSWYHWNYAGYGIRDGKVYAIRYDKLVPGITDAAAVWSNLSACWIVTESGLLFTYGENRENAMAGVTQEANVTTPVLLPIQPLAEETVAVTGNNLTEGVLTADTLTLTFNKELTYAAPVLYADGTQVPVQFRVADYNTLQLYREAGFAEGVAYELVFAAESVHALGGITNAEEIRIAFTYAPGVTEETPEDTTEDTTEDTAVEEVVIHESQLDESIERILTPESLIAKLEAYFDETQYNPVFNGNAILNPISTDSDVTHWLRPLAPSVSAGTYSEIPLGGNWWGTTNETAIGLQMVDYTDFVTYARLMYAPYLTEAPENTFPFVTSVTLLNKYGEAVTTVGNEEVTFRVTFNRDMDISIPLQFRFGSAYPYGDYEVQGAYVDARTWEGTYTLNTLIENGNQFITISNGCSATDDLALQLDQARFGFVIDTSAAQALIMQGHATDTGIELTWTQDDFDTLMGYNVYRSDKEDGLYTRLNSTVIPADTMTWFDDTVEPGVQYYYNFTVVQTDLTESEPSGKISIMSKDTMAPNIYHSPVANAFTGANLVVTATVTDNLSIAYANLYYRVAGTDSWKTIRMNKLNDKYSAIIPAADVTVAGIEYYIEAFDGVSYTYKGAAEAPYTILVQEAVDASSLGDVDGDGTITNRDALVLLYAINDKYNMTAEEFARADLNGDGELWAAEALRILQYVSGTVGSLKMS